MAKNKFFSTKTMASLALFTALGYGLSFLEFPIFPATPFLKLDFTNVVTLLAGYMFGVGGAFVVELCKQLLIFLTHSDTAGVGQIANLIMTMAFVLPPVLMYNRLKGKKWVAVGMVAGSVAQIVASLLCNRFITFPLYMGESAVAVFNSLWWYIVAFNAIKAVAISVLTFVLYKRLEFVLDKMFARRAKQEQESADEGDNSAE
ncbi:MAG: ECF transporter S component [Clostridia bacterium]|nr:ECF transporter S component [Clostridia bacterium]